MTKTFSCEFDNCASVFTKKSDLKKHVVEHTDPSKVLRCTEPACEYSTLYPRGLDVHKNTHSNARPYACPDMIKDSASSDSPGGRSDGQPSVSEKPCTFRSNCPSSLLKHRVTHHGYKTSPHSRRGKPKVDRRARSSPYSSLPLLPKKTISSNRASSSSKHSSACASATVTSASSSMVQPLDNNPYYPAPDTRYGEVSNNNPYTNRASSSSKYSSSCESPTVTSAPPPMVQPLDNNHSSVPSQNNHTHHGVSALAFPILQHSPATALHQNPFQLPHNVKPSRPEAESTDSNAIAYWTANCNSYNSESAGSYAAFAPGPAGLPFDERFSAHPTPLHYYGASNGNAFAFAQESTNTSSAALQSAHDATTLPRLEGSTTPETESTGSGSVTFHTSSHGSSPNSSVDFPPSPVEIPVDSNVCISASTSVTQLDHSADRDVALPAPSPVPVPETPVDSFSSSGANGIVPSFSGFETEIHEADIFFRGTGREGCFFPEMTVNAGIEGWDGSPLDTYQEYYNYSYWHI